MEWQMSMLLQVASVFILFMGLDTDEPLTQALSYTQ